MTAPKIDAHGSRLAVYLGYIYSSVGLVLVISSAAVVVGWIGGREYLSPHVPFYWISVPILMGWIGTILVNVGRRLVVSASVPFQDDDPRRPVIYLRSFAMDRPMANLGKLSVFAWMRLATDEEQLVEALREIGPVIAIGKPGEHLPPIGANRIYVNEENWKEQVTQLMRRARLVVVLYGSTAGLKWEIDQALTILQPEQLLYAILSTDFQIISGGGKKSRLKFGVIGGFQYFTTNWNSHWVQVKKPSLLRRTVFRTKVPSFHLTLQPVFKNLSLVTHTPRLRLLNPLTGFVVVLIASFPAFLGLVVILSWLNNLYVFSPLPPTDSTPSLDYVTTYPAMSNQAADNMAKTYGYYLGQKRTVTLLSEKFPMLRLELTKAQANFDRNFKPSIEFIDHILNKENATWTAGKQEVSAAIETIDLKDRTLEQAQSFLEELQDRARGQIPSPIIETLLIYNPAFITHPEQEFLEGYRKVAVTTDHTKGRDIGLRIEYPTSWKLKEGTQLHTVYLLVSENGLGLETVVISINKLPVDVDDANRSLLDPSYLKYVTNLPANYRILSSGTTTIHDRPAAFLKYEVEEHPTASKIRARGILYLTSYQGNFVTIMCSTGLPKERVAELKSRYDAFELLFKLIAQSLKMS